MTLSIAEMTTLVGELVYQAGWTLRFEPVGPGKLVIEAQVPNSRYQAGHGKPATALYRREYVPPAATYDQRSFLRWVAYEVLWLSLHENLEWLRWVSTKEPLIEPHGSTATVTGLLPPRPGESWWGRFTATDKLIHEAEKVIDTEFREDIDFGPLAAAIEEVRHAGE